MALNKVTYTDDVTAIEAQNLNDIQDEIINNTVPKDTGGTFKGDVTVDKNRTGTNLGISVLTLGNDIPNGTAGNSYGVVRLYGKTDQYTNLSAGDSTATRGISLPDASGTIMLNDNPSSISIRNTSGVANQDNLLSLTLGNSTPRSQNGHSEGFIVSYGNNGYYTAVQANDATANRQIKFPDASGTLTVNQVGTWTPQLYDYETFKMSLGNVGEYIRIGSLAVFAFNLRIDSAVSFSTMMQVRGFPFSVRIFGGNLYAAGVANNFADRTIQYARNAVYFRPNFTGTVAANSWWSGMFIGIVA